MKDHSEPAYSNAEKNVSRFDTVRVLGLATRRLRAIVRGMTSARGLLGLGAGGVGGIVIPISLADDYAHEEIGLRRCSNALK